MPVKRPRTSQKSSDAPKADPMMAHLAMLGEASKSLRRPVFCSGAAPVSAEDIVLFYGKDEHARRLDFSNASEENLTHLAESCDPAAFGLNDKDVLDPSYRKAGKLDTAHFATTFDPERCGLVHVIRNEFLEGPISNVPIRIERYKLNVYGKGGFFKAHKDTPRSESMFGSLVIVLPTKHEGGSLAFRDGEEEWAFHSANVVAREQDNDELRVGYAVFYSDVEHSVTEVLSGYRVTLTYNLYFEQPPPGEPGLSVDHYTGKHKLSEGLKKLLADPTFLPEGGRLGFALQREYPVKPGKTKLRQIEQYLRGGDAVLFNICKELSLKVSLKALVGQELVDSYIGSPEGPVLCDKIPKASRFPEEAGDWVHYLCEEFGGKLTQWPGSSNRRDYIPGYFDTDPHRVTINWVTPPKLSITKSKEQYMAYGNESILAYVYSYICLIVKVGPFGKRVVTVDQPVTESEH